MQEAGLDGFDIVQWHALFAPKGTPKPKNEKLSSALEKLSEKAVVERFADLGTVPVPPGRSDPMENEAQLKNEVQKWAKLIRGAGAEPQ